MGVQSDSQGYHEIKVYNDTKDSMWAGLSRIEQASNRQEFIDFAGQLHIVLLRADSIWLGIQESVNQKALKMKIGESKHFKYEGEMLKEADKLETYIDYLKNPAKFVDKDGRMEKVFESFLHNNTEQSKLEFLKKQISDVVRETDATWNRFAAKIGAGLPLKIAEEKEVFFRD